MACSDGEYLSLVLQEQEHSSSTAHDDSILEATTYEQLNLERAANDDDDEDNVDDNTCEDNVNYNTREDSDDDNTYEEPIGKKNVFVPLFLWYLYDKSCYVT